MKKNTFAAEYNYISTHMCVFQFATNTDNSV